MALGTFAAIKGLMIFFSGGKTQDAVVLTIIGTVFAAFGYGFVTLAIVSFRSQKRDAAVRAANPGQPWLWRKDWAEGRINAGTKATMWFAWTFALFWNAVSSGPLFAVASANIRQQPALLLALVFPIIGAGLLIWAIRETIEWKKFGQSTFKMLSVPGAVGGRLGGAIETAVKIRPEDGFHLKLVCVHRIRTGSGKNSSVSENIIWEDKKTMARELLDDDPSHTAIPVSFLIPPDARESDDQTPNDRIIWRLEIRAKVPGVNYAAKFEVPVFRTAESAAVSASGPDPALAYEAPEEPYRLPPHSRITIRQLPDGGTEFHFPALRNLGIKLSLTVMWLVWTSFTLAAHLVFHSLFFEIVFALVDVLLTAACFSLWTKSSRLKFGANGVRVTNRWLFLGRTRVFDPRDVAGFELKSGMRSGQTQFFNLLLRTTAGEKLTVASYIPGVAEAQWLCGRLEKALDRRA